jgi:BMFP domain-containing protein YqiC
MTQTSNRIFDEMARLMNDAAGVAQGVRREFDNLFRTQAERILRDLDVVQREEFEAVKDMARLAREENEALKARLEALEARVAAPEMKAGGMASDKTGDKASENEALKARLDALEAKAGDIASDKPAKKGKGRAGAE